MLSVMASSHQCHPKYFGQGRQCVANSYAAMIHHSMVKKASKWTPKDLDEILLEGDNIYYNVIMGGQKEQYLLVADLPNEWNNCKLKILKSEAGSISSVKPVKPYVSLNQTISNIEKFVFLTIKCYTKAIIKENDIYFVFDPHSRNRSGMIKADGKAALTSYSKFEDLLLFLEKFSSSLGDKESECIPFEATHVDIMENTGTSESDEFEGFSDISDREYSCILQMIEGNKEEKIKRIEEELEQANTSDLADNIESDHSLFSVHKNHETSSTVKSAAELSEDDIPLSKLSKLLKFNTYSSDSEYISSGSEYQLSHFEKKMLNESNYSETSSSDLDSVKTKRNTKRKSKKGRKEHSKRKKDVNKLGSTSEIEHSYSSKVERASKDKVTAEETQMTTEEETQMTTEEENVSNIIESKQQYTDVENEEKAEEEVFEEMDIAGEITIDGVYNEEIVDQSEIQSCDKFDNEHGIEGQCLDKAEKVTVERVVEADMVDQSELQFNISERAYDIQEDLDLGIDDETVTTESASNLADNSMEEMVGDISFDGCVSGTGRRTEHVRGRKRTRKPDNWRRCKAKRHCNSGERYINANGKIQKAKKIQKGCGQSCRFKCHSVFTEENREEIFHSFWKLGDPMRQRQFLLKYSAPQKKKEQETVE